MFSLNSAFLFTGVSFFISVWDVAYASVLSELFFGEKDGATVVEICFVVSLDLVTLSLWDDFVVEGGIPSSSTDEEGNTSVDEISLFVKQLDDSEILSKDLNASIYTNGLTENFNNACIIYFNRI